MTYSEEQYNALLAVCRSYKNDYDNAFERIKAQQREIEQLKDENCELTKKLKARLTCDFVKTAQIHAVPDFAEKLKDEIKQAKIDVLGELRTYCVERENYKGIQQQQNEDLLRINDERKFHPELTLDEIFVIRTGADKANGQSTMANKVVEKIDRMIEELKK